MIFIKKIILFLVAIFMIVAIYACAPNQTESAITKDIPSMFVEIEETGNLQVVYHKDTKVIYVVCMQSYNRENLPNNFTLLVNPDGTPMLYEGM